MLSTNCLRLLSIYLIIIMSCSFPCDAQFFRNDYQYNPDADGWLKLHRMPAKWHDARLRCYSEGSALASPMTGELVVSMIEVLGYHQLTVFTGIADAFSSGEYRSVEGKSINDVAAPWAPMEPDNHKGLEQCIAMFPNATLADVSCNIPHPYICYRKSSRDLQDSIRCSGTTDSEYYYENVTGHCYKFHGNGQIWRAAHMICAAEGGYLAIINSDEEAQALKRGAEKFPTKYILAEKPNIFSIGFHDWNQHGLWMTVHGQTLQEAGYSRWGQHQPDNAGNAEFCGSMLRSGELNDSACQKTSPFICEMEPNVTD